MGGIRYRGDDGGPPPITSFSDTLIGADRPFYIGNQYYLVGLADSTVAPVDWAAQLNLGGTGLTYGNGGGVNDNGMACWAFPSNMDYAATVAKSLTAGLFAQFTIAAKPAAGVNSSIGVVLLANPGVSPGYFLQCHSADANTPIFRKDNAGSTNLVASAFANAVGNVVRMESRYVAGNVELRTYQNGSLQNTFTDSTVNRITGGGSVGLAFTGVFTGQITISNFSCGTL